MKKAKKFWGIFLALTLLFSSVTAVSANSKESNESFVSLDDITKYQDKTYANAAPNEVIITDPVVIKKLATEQGFPDVQDNKKLTYTIGKVESSALEDEIPHSKAITVRTFISDVEDKGTGFKLQDHFDENRYQGPISGTYKYSRTDTSTYNSTVSLNAEIVSAGIGFTIGKSYTKSDSVTINVPAGKRTILKIWTNYQKKTFTVYNEFSSSVGLWYPQGTGSAYKPVGLIFTQAEY